MRYFRFITICLAVLFGGYLNGQSLVNNPCGYAAANEFQDGDCGISVTTAGFTSLLDITECSTGATTIDDGWFWYDGTGGGANTITFTPDPGFDAVIHVLEGTDLDPCAGFFYGDCADDAGAGGAETIIGGGQAGVRYIVMIENVGDNTTMTGTLCMTENAATCDDYIQNGTETGVDCGGSCPYGCPPPTTGSSGSCTSTINTTIDVITCDLIGTAGFNETTGQVDFDGSVKNGIGSTPEPSCGWNIGNSNNLYASWATYDPLTGVTAASFDAFDIVGSADISYAAYQGGTCGTMTEIACGTFASYTGVNSSLEPVNFSGIDDTQPLYFLLYSSKAYTLSANMQGFASVPSNDDCASAAAATGDACNLGATPSSFIPPSNYNAGICSGGTWYSNENTVYYSFSPDSANAELQISNILCNDGGSGGTAQFGVWTSCAAISLAPTAGNGFLGCAVGTQPLTLSGLDTASTYYIVVDGNAGSACSWNFSATGIVLPITLIEFNARLENNSVNLKWLTESETNNDFFTVEKSLNGKDYEVVGVVPGAGNSNVVLEYQLNDDKPFDGVSYYRLKQTDYDGKFSYSEVQVVKNIRYSDIVIYPNPSEQNVFLTFNSDVVEEESIVSVFDVFGRKIYSSTVKPNIGSNKIEIPSARFSKGLYFVEFDGQKAKFIKE